MKHMYGLGLAILALLVLSLLACSKPPATWTSPASPEEFDQLERASLEVSASPERRAQLFFLWGQELAQAARQAGDTSLRQRAMGAFAKVIDLSAVLVDESRFNLEILVREDQQNQQDKSQKQDQKDKSQDQNKPDQNKPGQDQKDQKDRNKPDQKKSGQDQKGQSEPQAQDQKAGSPKDQPKAAKDLSALVKDKVQDASLDQALKQENERQAQEQVRQAGKIVPVEKDW